MSGGRVTQSQRWKNVGPELTAAIALHRAGKLDKAGAIYHRILKKTPDHPDALNLLGAIANSCGRPKRGIQLILMSLRSCPGIPDAHVNLGNSYAQLGQREDAIASYRRAIELKPDFALAHSSLARELVAVGHHQAAIAAAELACKLDTDMPEAHIHLGTACWRLGRLDDAVLSLRRALMLRPDDATGLRVLGVVYVEQLHFELARPLFMRLTALLPKDPRAQRDLGMCLFRAGDTEEAIAALRLAVALADDYTVGWISLGWALRALGRFDNAVECFRRALAIDPDNAEAKRSLTTTGVHEANESEISSLTARLNDPHLDDTVRITTGFVLGGLLDRQDRFDEAFASFATANAEMHRKLAMTGRGYDAPAMAWRVERLIDRMTPEFIAAARSEVSASDLPVFIVGMPRSGTTLVEQIAASHSQVFGAGELNAIPRIAAELPEPCCDPDTIARWRDVGGKLATSHLRQLQSIGSSARRVIDKLPDNIFHLGTIAALFPGARVIFCCRDPRDIGLSSYFQLFASGNPYSYDLADCAHRIRQVEGLRQHWQRSLPLSMLTVSYEALISDIEVQSRRLIEFLNLDWEPACLDFHRTERIVITQSTWQVRQPVYSRSVGRWRCYTAHLRPLLDTLSHAETSLR